MTVLSAGLMTVQGVGMTPAGVAAETVGARAAVAGAGRAVGTRRKGDRKPRHG
jgi:hypothetical protein